MQDQLRAANEGYNASQRTATDPRAERQGAHALPMLKQADQLPYGPRTRN